MSDAPRHLHVPNANSPQLLTRLLEMVARGVRSTRGLQEALGVEPRTVQYYTQAGQWLGFLDPDEDGALTALGLEYVYAASGRSGVYTRAVWQQPLAAELLAASGGRMPSVDDVLAAVTATEPDLAPATARRRASAVRALIKPAIGKAQPRSQGRGAQQLALPLSMAPTAQAPPRLPPATGEEWNPDVYRFLLRSLLDYGELSLGQVRALLDRAGADQVPIGGYVDMAIARGDASRRDERLVITDDAVVRRDVVESTASVILSDAQYRAYLADAVDAQTSRAAEIRRDRRAPRFTAWDQRVFGHALRPDQVRSDLERVLMDRSLESFHLAVREAPDRHPVTEPFLDAWEMSNLAIACPPYLAQLQGGVAGVNAILRQARRGAAEVALPDLSVRPALVHGGILHPLEPLPRSVPDTRSLRLRVLLCAPFPALATAVLLLHRQRPDRIDLVRGAEGWEVTWHRKRIGTLLSLVDRYGASRGWLVARRPANVDGLALMAGLEALGIAWIAGKRAVLEERFFGQLRRQPEEFEIFERLAPLAVSIEDWLDTEEAR